MIERPGEGLPAAKSVLNRLLVIRSHCPGGFTIQGDSDCGDVVHLRRGLAALGGEGPIDCGEGGAVLRFLALRASRLPGRHRLTGTARLLSRPREELTALLAGLGVEAGSGPGGEVVLAGEGWREPAAPLTLDLSRSSQFASALLLNAWDLPFPLEIEFTKERVSEGFLRMTLTLCRRAGMTLAGEERIIVPAGARVEPGAYRARADQGAAFALAAAAALAGRVVLPAADPLQPDGVYPEILRAMGVPLHRAGEELVVERAPRLRPIDRDLGTAPDLVPVLAVLCAFAPGTSRLQGAPHLAFKESHRIARTAGLVRLLGRACRERPDGLEIEGSAAPPPAGPLPFATDQDHRLAMAAGVAMKAGWPLRPDAPRVVAKSFPAFWRLIEVVP